MSGQSDSVLVATPEDIAFYGYESCVCSVGAALQAVSTASTRKFVRRNGFYHSHLLQSAVTTAIFTQTEGNSLECGSLEDESERSLAQHKVRSAPAGRARGGSQLLQPALCTGEERSKRLLSEIDEYVHYQQAQYVLQEDGFRPQQKPRRVSLLY